MIQKSNRITLGSFSMIKGIAILLVMLVHVFLLIPFDTEKAPLIQAAIPFLNSLGFLMPLFFMISGYSFKTKPVRKMLKKTFSEMIIPCLWVLAAIIVVYPVAFYFARNSWTESLNDTLHFVLAFLLGVAEYGTVFLGHNIAWIPAVWYLVALFVAFNILNLILKVKNSKAQIAFVVVCILFGYILSFWKINYYCLPRGFLAVGYCYLGYIIKTHKLLERYVSSFWLYIIISPIVLLYFKFGVLNLSARGFLYGLWSYVGAGFTSMLFMFLGVYLGRYDSKATDWLKQVGIYSYWILCIHGVEMEIPQWSMLAARMPEHQYLALLIIMILKGFVIGTCCVILKKLSQYRYKRRALMRG